MSDNELKYVNDVFKKNWIAPVGPHITKFEEMLSNKHENYSVAALNSGTSAIHLALIILGVKSGDDVLCSSFTFAATANPIKYIGANPVFIDSEYETWNMCPLLLEKAIKERNETGKKPKAIILVHLYGMPAKIDEILNISKKFDIPVIEDAAEALGSTYKKKNIGTFGDFGVFSFNGNKIITTSGGGALISKNKKFISQAKYLSTQARDNQPHYEHSKIGYNYRLSNVCAAIGIGQMEVLNSRVEKKRCINKIYKEQLSCIDEIKFLEENENNFSNFWLTTIVINEKSKIKNDDIRLYLESLNIESRPLWKPMHLQPVFSSSKSYTNNTSDDLFQRGLCLPSGTNMSDEEINRVVLAIKKLYAK
ncbi:MAG: pyridoxal phosphate-dependent aminotransferase [Flavobacteriales bacterium]|nr:pyridoxal phosphate-dependent aminotransferase [Flavobacteriales bacterium]